MEVLMNSHYRSSVKYFTYTVIISCEIRTSRPWDKQITCLRNFLLITFFSDDGCLFVLSQTFPIK